MWEVLLLILPALPLALGLNLFKVGPSSAIALVISRFAEDNPKLFSALAIALSKSCLISVAAFLFVKVNIFNASFTFNPLIKF